MDRFLRDFRNAAITRGMSDTDDSRLYERFHEIVAAIGDGDRSH